jgi:mRNA-degrading endonuclease RelE of RelBE toxin-antitoxin system
VTIFKQVERSLEFEKDLKKLPKRFPTLESDLETFINKELALYHKLRIDNHGVFPIPGLGFEFPKVYKAKKFACRALKGKGVQSGIRVIYAYFEPDDRIVLIEIYFKGDKENEDRKRIIDSFFRG